MKCTFPRYNLRDNSLQLVVRHLSSFFPFSRLLHLLFVRALVYIFPMKNCFHNPPIDTPSKEVLWFYDFTKKKKKTPFSHNNRSNAQTRDNNSGENSQSIWKSRYSPIPSHCVAFDLSKGLHLLSIVPLLFEAKKSRREAILLHSSIFFSTSRTKERIVRASSSI